MSSGYLAGAVAGRRPSNQQLLEKVCAAPARPLSTWTQTLPAPPALPAVSEVEPSAVEGSSVEESSVEESAVEESAVEGSAVEGNPDPSTPNEDAN